MAEGKARGDEAVSRREVIQASAGSAVVAGAAGLIAGAGGANAQQAAQAAQGSPGLRGTDAPQAGPAIRRGEQNPFYDYSPIVKRPKLTWPNNARVAVYIVLNVEHWDVHGEGGRMDVRNNPRNDYGLRVAIWRLFNIFNERYIKTTIALNSAVTRFYPDVIEASKSRGDEFMGHGITNSEHLDLIPSASGAVVVREAVDTIARATGARVRGWLGPGLGEADGTLDQLKAAGIEYVCDWGPADDQPFPLKNGMHVVPYWVDINDIGLIDRQGTPASQFAAYIVDAFDTLYREGEESGRVLPIALHPFLIGAPHRVPHLVKAIDHIRGHQEVWFAKGGEILDAYKASVRT